jgi:hypothetical protein
MLWRGGSIGKVCYCAEIAEQAKEEGGVERRLQWTTLPRYIPGSGAGLELSL